MTLSVDALLVVSLMMAVFAAVSTVGCSLYLGVGFERLRSGFESIKKQTAFFSNAIHSLDTRVDAVEKQDSYFFEAINNLEQQAQGQEQEIASDDYQSNIEESLILAGKDDALHSGMDNLLSDAGFVTSPARETSSEGESGSLHFH